MMLNVKYDKAIEKLRKVLEPEGMTIEKIDLLDWVEILNDDHSLGPDSGTYYRVRPEIVFKV